MTNFYARRAAMRVCWIQQWNQRNAKDVFAYWPMEKRWDTRSSKRPTNGN